MADTCRERSPLIGLVDLPLFGEGGCRESHWTYTWDSQLPHAFSSHLYAFLPQLSAPALYQEVLVYVDCGRLTEVRLHWRDHGQVCSGMRLAHVCLVVTYVPVSN